MLQIFSIQQGGREQHDDQENDCYADVFEDLSNHE
jgi:hypothetical protein